MSWQSDISSIFDTLTPAQTTARDPYWHEKEVGIHSPTQNSAVRIRDYTTDGHATRQETQISSGNNAGAVYSGNDNGDDNSYAVTYADVIVNQGTAFNLTIPPGGLLWNSTPFNEALNPTFNMPVPIQLAEDVVQFAKGLTTNATLADLEQQVTDIIAQIRQSTPDAGLIPDGAIDFSDPFQAFCTVTAQKVPMFNYAAIMFLQMLFMGTPGLLIAPPPAGIVTLGPVGIALSKLAAADWEPHFEAKVDTKVLGSGLQQLLLSAVPGMNLVAS